ncbi:MAG: hypothetical protein RIS73_353 [Bacteroidota bacterium]|jgi:hypothetical protein
MHLAKLTMTKFLPVFFVACGLQTAVFAQENSPYSRYGLGDLAPNHSVLSRGMGGIAAGVMDYQNINFVNPATLASLSNTIFEIGAEIDIRALKSANPAKKFTSVNTLFSYVQLAFPLTTEKMRKKDISWGMTFGLRPVTKINYKIEKNSRLSGIDSLYTLYEGNGGANEAFIGTGLKIKNFSFGVNAGYMFGNKDYSTKLVFINDTVEYHKANFLNQTTFGGLFVSGGLQYEVILNKDKRNEFPRILRIGAYGNLKQKLQAKRDNVIETFDYDANSSSYRIDSVYEQKNVKGNIEYPASYSAGFTYQDEHWLWGADFEATQWNNYRYYGQTDQVQNNWMIRAGAQYYPAKQNTPVKKYFNYVKYRAGFYYGPDYIKTNNKRPEYAFTLGTGMPLTSLRYINYNGEYVMLNTALEIGGRGDKKTNLRENTVRFSIGVSMNARWFAKRKYN